MALRELDLTKYYEINDKITADQFSYLLKDMEEEAKDMPYHSCCVSDVLSRIYSLPDYQIASFTKDYGEIIEDENNNLEDIRIFGVTMDLEHLLIVCGGNVTYGYTPLDIIANFAVQNNIATEIEIMEEAMDLYDEHFKKKKEISKQLLFRKYKKDK